MEDKGFFAYIAILFIAIVGIPSLLFAQITFEYETTYNEMWYADCPFGRFYVDVEGDFSFLSGTITSTPSESYIIKYFESAELKTLILDAKHTSVIFDGTFRLETIMKNRYIFGRFDYTYSISYKIHLPFKPQINSTPDLNQTGSN